MSFLNLRTTWVWEKLISLKSVRAERVLEIFLAGALCESQYWEKSKLEEYQANMRRRVLVYAHKNILYWRDTLDKIKFSDAKYVDSIWYKIPLVGRAAFNLIPEKNYVNPSVAAEFGRHHITSGSTGTPFVFFADTRSYPMRRALNRRRFEWVGAPNEISSVRILSADRFGFEDTPGFIQCLGRSDVFRKTKDIFNLLQKGRTVVEGFASLLFLLARFIEREHRNYDITAVISSGEMLTKSQRQYMENIFRAPVFNFYVAREGGFLGFECQVREGFHVNAENVFLEIVRADGRPCLPGETGYVALTTFDNFVMPLIRYKIGDLGSIIEEPCRCGRTLPRLKLVGRSSQLVLLPSGRIESAYEVMRPVTNRIRKFFQYQLVQNSLEEFQLSIAPTKEYTADDEVAIFAEMKEFLGPEVNLSIKKVREIPAGNGGKEQAFVSYLPTPSLSAKGSDK